MFMKKIRLFCAFLCACLLCGCTSSTVSGGSGETVYAEPTPCIAILLKAMDNPYFNLIKAGAEAEADALGVQVIVVFPESESDTEDQVDMLHTLAAMSVDVIAVAPTNADALHDDLDLARENGKIIMAIDSSLTYPECACLISTDQYGASYQQGVYAAGLVEQGSNAVILRGQASDKSHTLRQYGLTDGLTDNGVHILETSVCNSSEEEAALTMEQLLTQYSDIDIVCTTADSMAIGAQSVIEQSGRDIRIVSFDGMQDVCELVKDGKIDAVFAQDPYLMGQLCVRNAVRLVQGEDVQRTIYVDTQCITRSNAQERIDDIKNCLTRQNTKRQQ